MFYKFKSQHDEDFVAATIKDMLKHGIDYGTAVDHALKLNYGMPPIFRCSFSAQIIISNAEAKRLGLDFEAKRLGLDFEKPILAIPYAMVIDATGRHHYVYLAIEVEYETSDVIRLKQVAIGRDLHVNVISNNVMSFIIDSDYKLENGFSDSLGSGLTFSIMQDNCASNKILRSTDVGPFTFRSLIGCRHFMKNVISTIMDYNADDYDA
jgi:hypothetical protein